MDSKLRALMVAIIAVLAIAAASMMMDGPPDDQGRTFPSPVTDDDKQYQSSAEARLDMESWLVDLDTSLADSGNDTYDMALAIDDATVELLTMSEKCVFVELDYQFDPSGMAEEYIAWNSLFRDAYDRYMMTVKDALKGPNADIVKDALEYRGEDPDSYLEYSEMTPEKKALLDRQKELEAEYNALMGTVSSDEASELEQFTDAIEVYIELVRNNNTYAALCGYDNYMDYMFEKSFGREYGPSDLSGFLECADEALEMWIAVDQLQMEPGNSMYELQWMAGLDRYEVRPYIEPFMGTIDDDMSELLGYMYDNELLYTDKVEGQLPGGYCIPLVMHNSAIIYMPSVNFDFMRSLIHEFGHASNDCLVADRTTCFDIKEIHSKGLELLYCEYQEGRGMKGAEAFTLLNLKQMAFTIFLSCALTDIETWAYEVDADKDDGIELTLEGLVDRFGSGYGKYINMTEYIGVGYDFIAIPHIISSPGYYISYGTSCLNAMEIWQMAKIDYGAASETYADILFQNGVDGYVEAVELAGLTNMLVRENAEDALDEIIQALHV